ncbi:MAG: penicillin acylase family protein, partial [bacterium]|nr:penicillin acylase family protein [bacterium]
DLENMPYYLTMAKPGSPPNQRGARALELLGADDSVTAEEAIAYATDVHPYGVDRWLEVLRGAHTAAGVQLGQNSRYRVGMRIMEEWDARLTRDSQGALCYYYWRKQMVEDYGRDGMGGVARRIDDPMASLGEEPKPIELTGVELGYAAASFARAMDKMEADLGNLNGVYGDVFRAGRDDTSHPVGGGGDGHLGTTTFRNVNYHGERPDHTRWGRSGQTSTQIVVLSKPIRSWTAPPIGQSDRPDSPHYLDQAENLFGPRKMKPTWWMPEDLVGHIESRTELAPRL